MVRDDKVEIIQGSMAPRRAGKATCAMWEAIEPTWKRKQAADHRAGATLARVPSRDWAAKGVPLFGGVEASPPKA